MFKNFTLLLNNIVHESFLIPRVFSLFLWFWKTFLRINKPLIVAKLFFSFCPLVATVLQHFKRFTSLGYLGQLEIFTNSLHAVVDILLLSYFVLVKFFIDKLAATKFIITDFFNIVNLFFKEMDMFAKSFFHNLFGVLDRFDGILGLRALELVGQRFKGWNFCFVSFQFLDKFIFFFLGVLLHYSFINFIFDVTVLSNVTEMVFEYLNKSWLIEQEGSIVQWLARQASKFWKSRFNSCVLPFLHIKNHLDKEFISIFYKNSIKWEWPSLFSGMKA